MDNLVDLQMMPQEPRPQEIEIPADGMSLGLLQAVYRCASLPLRVRIRAAVAALPHEVPKLGITAVVSEQDFGTLLERRLQRIDQTKLIETKPTPPVEVKPALSQDLIPRSYGEGELFYGSAIGGVPHCHCRWSGWEASPTQRCLLPVFGMATGLMALAINDLELNLWPQQHSQWRLVRLSLGQSLWGFRGKDHCG
jgi:hypothetical protein